MNSNEKYRPAIPEIIRREIQVEAGHKCSITNCNEHTYLEIHHINHNRQDNRKENLILLCDKHHKMAHAGIIDKKSLYSYKEILKKNSNVIDFVISEEADRTNRFIKTIQHILSYNYDGIIHYAGHDTGYYFDEEIHCKLVKFISTKENYFQDLRSYDISIRDRQDRVVYLLEQILDIRQKCNYIDNGSGCAKFIPVSAIGTSEYYNEVENQKIFVENKLLEIEKIIQELFNYVMNKQ